MMRNLTYMIDKYVLDRCSKDSCSENFAIIGKKMFVTEFTLREVAIFLKEVSRQIYFLRIYVIFNIAVQIWTGNCDLNKK